MQNTIINFDLKILNSSSALDEVRNYLNKFDCPELSMDLSALNIIDAARILMLSSVYHYGKYPEGKIFCRYMSNEIKALVEGISIPNFELI